MKNLVEGLLVQACGSAEVLQPGIDLIDSGLLDSLAVIELFASFQHSGVDIQPTQMPLEKLRTVQGICSFLEEHNFFGAGDPSS